MRTELHPRLRFLWLLPGVLALSGAYLMTLRGPERGFSARERALIANLVLETQGSPTPEASDPELVALGHALFFDPALSRSGDLSCAACHEPDRYFTDGLRTSHGREVGRRNTPSLIGASRFSFLNWDGSADSVWSQALMPIESGAEMGGNRLAVAHHVAECYASEYVQLFGDLPDLEDEERFPPNGKPVPGDPSDPAARAWVSVSQADRDAVDQVFVNVGKSIEAYVGQLVPRESAFDRFARPLVHGGDPEWEVLSDSAIRGLRVFIGRGGCMNCHNGPLLTDFGFHNIGLPGGGVGDVGHSRGARKLLLSPFRSDRRYGQGDHPGQPMRYFRFDPAEGRGAFKTPSLRNVAETAPYGHAGQFAALREMVSFYTSAEVTPETGTRDRALTVVDVSDVEDLVAFLETLKGGLPDECWLSPPAAGTAMARSEDVGELGQ